MKKADVSDVRKAVYRCRGKNVVVRTNQGRHRFGVDRGVIKEVYPYVFMIEIKNRATDTPRMVSFTYNDILTHDVQLTLLPAAN